ncbi:beta-glucosidase 45 [Hibiscus trionum]|uniref:Beta-glucosidase 45 n=1 Tax=Hibiscus trionum TaxID=183268 RepID=A0A9W7IK65_HIBTR|nr:beta-glucosidase 45 [Hibiscus trionum]
MVYKLKENILKMHIYLKLNYLIKCLLRKIKNNDNGYIADDNYHRFLEDIEIAYSLGVNAYRFLISWARILPGGMSGEVNPAGIDFYNKVIDYLLHRGIEPFVTIHHFNHPLQLDRDRLSLSWLNHLIREEFVHFAETCFESFGDRVKYWSTINEPNIFAEMRYVKGVYPPARCSQPFRNCSAGSSDKEPFIVVHNMLLAHAKDVKRYQERFQVKE